MEILNNIYGMWVEFWNSASGPEKILAVANTIGAIYTFIITWALYQKVDDYHKNHHSWKARLANIAMVGIMIGSFFSAIAVHVPDIPQACMHAGMTMFITVGYLLVRKYKSQVTDYIE
jgi:ABC-type Fe3+-siderophore transport system permease subunit